MKIFHLAWFHLFGFSFLPAQEPVIISKTTDEIRLDGRIEEQAWKRATAFDLVMNQPVSGIEPTEPTKTYLLYDDRNFYVAGILCDSEVHRLQSPTKKRDDMGLNNDWFGVNFDTFNDKENALAFWTTPAGLRLDMNIYNDAQGGFPVNPDWNTFWDVFVARNDSGWTAEFRIPISSLRFQEKEGRVLMGFTAGRYIGRKNEWNTFPEKSNLWGFWSWAKPSLSREIIFEDLHSRKPFYLAPYLLGGFTRDHVLNDQETDYITGQITKLEPGLDLKFGLTSNFTADITINTDFAQVEADDQQVNLTRFSLFFPEKRLFFLERSSIFNFNFGGYDRLFYSRRIGIHEGEPVRIYGGARLVGRQGPWDMGFLSMQTAPAEEIPGQNNSVLRLRRQVINENSYLGGMFTSLVGSEGSYNFAYGLDGIFRLLGENYLSFAWAQTFMNDQVNELFSVHPARYTINLENRAYSGFSYNLDFSYAGESFDPGIGFQIRKNYSRVGNSFGYGWIPAENSFIERHRIEADGYLITGNTQGKPESGELGPVYSLTTKTGWAVEGELKYFFEDVPDTFYLDGEVYIPDGIFESFGGMIDISTPHTLLWGVSLSGHLGSFYDGRRKSLRISPSWNVSSSLDLSASYQVNRVSFPARDQLFTSHIARLRILYMLNTKFSVTAFAQYSSVSDGIISNIRIRYNPKEGNDLYIVYNELLNTGRKASDPIPPLSDSRTILVKYTYTFNL